MKKSTWKLLTLTLMVLAFFTPLCQKPNNAYAASSAITYEALNYSVHCSINDTWGSHDKIQVTIDNTSSSTISNWSVSFKLQGEITEIWNARISAHVNDLYVINNVAYNQDIPAHDSVSFEFIIFSECEYDLPSEFIVPLKEVSIPSSEYNITIIENASWDNNYSGEIIITNLSEDEITDWNLTIEFNTDIYSIWNASITSKQNHLYTLENLNYNQNISPGESVSIGFLGTTENGNISISEHKLTEYTTAEVLDNLIIEADFEGLIPITNNYYITPLYTLDGEVSAYQIQYLNEAGNDCSYIIVNNAKCSKDTYYVEFGYGSSSTISKLKSLYHDKTEHKDYRILYLGGTNFYLQDNSALYVLSENGLCELSSSEIQLLFSLDTNTYYDYGDTLTYQEIVSIEVGYSKRNTYYKDVATGIEDVLRNRGLTNASVSIYKDVNWYAAMSCIDKRPVYLSLKGSEIYSDHGVLGVGYISFTHSTGWVSKYFQIADAWESTYHYVNYSLGIDEIRLLEVTFGGN